jgi:hypothetical protein
MVIQRPQELQLLLDRQQYLCGSYYFFHFSFLKFSKLIYRGTIKIHCKSVSLVNVLLYNKLDNVPIDFKQSSNLGQFELVCPDAETKNFIPRQSFWGYKTFILHLIRMVIVQLLKTLF